MRIKKLIFITIAILFLTNFAKAELNISLKKYLDENDLDKSLTQIYLLKRCSAVYAYASGISSLFMRARSSNRGARC